MHFPPVFAFLAATPTANLAVTMLIVFGSAKLLEELSERLGLPGIVGQILAGILIGPSVAGWISPSELTATMAELGVMFLAVPRRAWKSRPRNSCEPAPPQCWSASWEWRSRLLAVGRSICSGARSNLEAIFLGTALTATSVGITAQVLAARGLLQHTAARIILGAAVVDDILALLLLGFVSSIAEGTVDLLELAATSASRTRIRTGGGALGRPRGAARRRRTGLEAARR